jgi:hypothetical protein
LALVFGFVLFYNLGRFGCWLCTCVFLGVGGARGGAPGLDLQSVAYGLESSVQVSQTSRVRGQFHEKSLKIF